MSAEAPTSKQLRRLGAVVIALIIGLGYTASKIPEWLRPDSLKWAVTIPVTNGADGIAIGSAVLLGGIPQGRVTKIRDIEGNQEGPPNFRNLIWIEFELNQEITLARNAVIRLGSSTAGNMGFLDIKFPGSPAHLFKSGEERVIAIAQTSPPGGPMSGIIGRTNGELISQITSGMQKVADDAEKRKRIIESDFRSTQTMIKQMEIGMGDDVTQITGKVQAIIARYRMIFEMIPRIRLEALRLQQQVDYDSQDLRADLERWRHRLTLIDVDIDPAREDVRDMQEFADQLEPRLKAVALDLQSAMADADSIAIRTRALAPEISKGLNRTTARMVLAGGQLKRAMNDLLPLAIEAITIRPDRNSESQRLLLESTNDVVLAGMQLRDAARFLEEASRRGRAGTTREFDPPPNLDQSLRHLEKTMDRLAERLRQEIEADLR